MNKIIVGSMSVLILAVSAAWAQEANVPGPSLMSSAQLIEVGNKICPVSGNPVGQMGPVVKHEYNGKVYNLCCPMCHRTFDSDPEKYAKIAEDEAASQNK